MKNWKPLLLVVWVIALVLFLVYYIIPNENQKGDAAIRALEYENEELIAKAKVLELEINQLKKQATQIQGQIKNSDLKVEQLEIELDEKINSINSMSDLDLYDYFTEFKADSTKHK